MNWSFLDKLDKNLLYVYAKSLNVKGATYFSRVLFDTTYKFEGDVYQKEEKKELYLAEKWRETAYYLLWFVYRYVLGCETYEDAVKYATLEILEKYKLAHFFKKRHIYIGVYKTNAIYLYNLYSDKTNMEDVKIALDILYNRYDFCEQLECYVRHTQINSNYIKSSTYRCQELIREAKALSLKSVRNTTAKSD